MSENIKINFKDWNCNKCEFDNVDFKVFQKYTSPPIVRERKGRVIKRPSSQIQPFLSTINRVKVDGASITLARSDNSIGFELKIQERIYKEQLSDQKVTEFTKVIRTMHKRESNLNINALECAFMIAADSKEIKPKVNICSEEFSKIPNFYSPGQLKDEINYLLKNRYPKEDGNILPMLYCSGPHTTVQLFEIIRDNDSIAIGNDFISLDFDNAHCRSQKCIDFYKQEEELRGKFEKIRDNYIKDIRNTILSQSNQNDEDILRYIEDHNLSSGEIQNSGCCAIYAKHAYIEAKKYKSLQEIRNNKVEFLMNVCSKVSQEMVEIEESKVLPTIIISKNGENCPDGYTKVNIFNGNDYKDGIKQTFWVNCLESNNLGVSIKGLFSSIGIEPISNQDREIPININPKGGKIKEVSLQSQTLETIPNETFQPQSNLKFFLVKTEEKEEKFSQKTNKKNTENNLPLSAFKGCHTKIIKEDRLPKFRPLTDAEISERIRKENKNPRLRNFNLNCTSENHLIVKPKLPNKSGLNIF